MLTEAARCRLREIATAAVRAAAHGDEPPRTDPAEGALGGLEEHCGAFVTLKKAGRLRGCIGTIRAHAPARVTVCEMAVSATRRDPRFPPVGPDEVDDLSVEISLLSPLERIDGPDEVEVGRDGLYVVNGARSGLLLPQVAVEYGWHRDEFLARTCSKAGLPPEAWREDDTELYRFEAEVL